MGMRMSLRSFGSWGCPAVVAAVLLVGSVHAGPVNLITNGSFETGAFVNNGSGAMSLLPGATAMTGWTTYSAELTWMVNGNSYAMSTPYGNSFIDFTGYHDSSPYGGVWQDIVTVPGGSYDLSFSVGTQQSLARYSGPVTVTASAGSALQSFTSNPAGAGNQWETFTLNFQASSTTTTISLLGLLSTGGEYIGLDNVSVVASTGVPEIDPAGMGSVLALVTGALGLMERRRLKGA